MSKQYTVSNGTLTAVFSTRGAELLSLRNAGGKEYIYRNEAVWGYSAPNLFPICGGLKDDKFIYDGKEYILAKHGFVRDAEFVAENVGEKEITFLFTDNDETYKCYPFRFEFRIIYALDGDMVRVTYDVKNKGDGEMYFSVGCHEAYYTPGGIQEYTVVFDKLETLDSHIVRGNLLDYETVRIMENEDKLPLSYDYFSVDALAFSKFESEGVTLMSNDGERIIKVDFPGFSHLLLWTKSGENAPYICIEPWCGFPDMVDSEYDITRRPGIVRLDAGSTKKIVHTITAIK